MGISLMFKAFVAFYMSNLIWNIIATIIIVGVFIALWIFNRDWVKFKAITLLNMGKAELSEITEGKEKFDMVFSIIEKNPIYKNTVFKYINREFVRKMVQSIFNKNKEQIKNF